MVATSDGSSCTAARCTNVDNVKKCMSEKSRERESNLLVCLARESASFESAILNALVAVTVV